MPDCDMDMVPGVLPPAASDDVGVGTKKLTGGLVPTAGTNELVGFGIPAAPGIITPVGAPGSNPLPEGGPDAPEGGPDPIPPTG